MMAPPICPGMIPSAVAGGWPQEWPMFVYKRVLWARRIARYSELEFWGGGQT